MSKDSNVQVIERARENVKALKFAAAQHAFKAIREEIEHDLELAEIVLAGLTTLSNLGYTYHGGQLWKPPVGLPPSYINNDRAELDAYRNASKEPVAEVVAWSHSEKTGRTCDVRLLRFDLKPCLLYAAPQIQPVSEPYKLPTGWIAVPVEPTENMIIEGFESKPDESFSTPEVWEAYQAMSGCQQAAHRAKLCWSAMLAAAPKMDDVNSSVRELAPKKQ